MASYGGAVTAGSLCANLQSIGVNGLRQAGNAMASAVGGATTGAVAVSVNGIKNDQVADAPCAPCKKTT
ncbi:hypothetical protein K457DRAFT_131909 [Linnemannia elongata AG-77]|uniref:Uncharacterized protein n=1 Tax=Linnemannia elongata AG-77 TaxID=1314771 RepID=A0A197KKH6_9FUNG|nr:hypothetical protein K457DRAFT_131909 [Linnemannia elongata AG-77]